MAPPEDSFERAIPLGRGPIQPLKIEFNPLERNSDSLPAFATCTFRAHQGQIDAQFVPQTRYFDPYFPQKNAPFGLLSQSRVRAVLAAVGGWRGSVPTVGPAAPLVAGGALVAPGIHDGAENLRSRTLG